MIWFIKLGNYNPKNKWGGDKVNNKQKKLFDEICKSQSLNDIQKYTENILEIRGFNIQSAQDKMLYFFISINQ